MTSSELARLAVKALEDKKAEDIRVLDIRRISTIADYFIIADGDNIHQVHALADNVEEILGRAGAEDPRVEGYAAGKWILLDYQDVIIHVFDRQDRLFYDLERIGIISADIADIVINEHVSTASQIIDIQKMADTTSKMVTNAITALNTKDEDLARKTIAMDDIVDKAFISAKQELISSFTKDTNVEYVLNLLMIAKYFEKIGDHAVNIAAWALFAITGVHTEEGGVN